MSRIHELFIDGRWIGPTGRSTMPVISPATTQHVADLTCATIEDSEQAAQAAKCAFGYWSSVSAVDRAKVLRRLAVNIEASTEEIAVEITKEQGKPVKEAIDEVKGVSQIFSYFAGIGETFEFDSAKPTTTVNRHIQLQPIGPVLIISTWNFPVEVVGSHLAPLLAAGCTAVVLANKYTPGSVVRFFRVLAEAPLPKGTVNLLMGGSTTALSDFLIAHPAIRHVSYTGSVNVGRSLASTAGRHLKRSTLELGGNAPAIVLPGSDVDAVGKALAGKRFWNAGQVCTAPNRIYVNRPQYEDLFQVIVEYAQALRVGDGMTPETDLGPVVNETRLNAIRRIIEDARTRGAEVVAGNSGPGKGGFFLAPTVLGRMPKDALGMREEIFGPAACVATYQTLDEALELANDCPLGLSGYVFGPDSEEALSVADRLEVGSVGVNQMTTAFIDTPFGGVKDSGLGHIGGESALFEYLFPKLTASAKTD